jgi:competence protein ComEA
MLSWLERSRWPLLGLTALLISIGIGVLIDRQFLQGPQPLEIRLDGAPAAEIQVYVAGAVAQPGVYYLRDGDRWIDALEAAGGPAADADLESVNLARRLRDEDQVLVPRLYEAAATPVGVLGAAQAPQGERIDINTAPAALLETLPGIGPTRAGRIVESRQTTGPFVRPEELVERGIVPQSVFEQILDLITVGP